MDFYHEDYFAPQVVVPEVDLNVLVVEEPCIEEPFGEGVGGVMNVEFPLNHELDRQVLLEEKPAVPLYEVANDVGDGLLPSVGKERSLAISSSLLPTASVLVGFHLQISICLGQMQLHWVLLLTLSGIIWTISCTWIALDPLIHFIACWVIFMLGLSAFVLSVTAS